MKILYSAGNRTGADQQLFRILPTLSDHQVKVAAHAKSSESLIHIDWTLDALYHKFEIKQPQELTKLFGHLGAPKINLSPTEILFQEVDDFGPDLIISDGEPVLAHIAQSLSIKLWYCSPLHLLDGILWNRGDLKYLSLLDATKKFLNALPPADKKFIYSPFGDLINPPKLRNGFQWIRPESNLLDNSEMDDQDIAIIQDKKRLTKLSKILNCLEPNITLFSCLCLGNSFSQLKTINLDKRDKYQQYFSKANWVFTTGESSYIADAIYNKVGRICIAPSLSDPETLLNAICCRMLNLGDDLAQVELMDKFSVDEIEKSRNSPAVSKYFETSTAEHLHQKVKYTQ